MIVRTLNSTYEVERHRHRFRRLHGARRTTPGGWSPFVRMGAVVLGEPLQFFTDAAADARRPGTAQVWTTSPVVEVE